MTAPARGPDRTALRDLAWLLPLALLVRALYQWQLARTPFVAQLLVDEGGYDTWARAVAAGRIVGETPFYQAPLYPYLVGAVYALFGPAASLVRLLQAAGGVLTVGILYLAGRRAFSPAAARAAGAGAALYAPFLFYEGMILKESLAILLTALLILLLLRADGAGRRGWLPAGIALGLLALLRENALLLLPLLWGWCLLRSGRSAPPLADRVVQAALLSAGMALALSPAVAHNLAAGGGFLLTTYQGGTNFYIGNHEGAPGVYTPIRLGRESPDFEGTDAAAEAERRAGRELTPGEVSRFWFAEGLRFARRQPGAYLALQARKLLLAWNDREVPDVWDIEFVAQRVPLLRAPLPDFGWVGPLGLLGIALAWPWRREAALLVLLVAGTTASVVLFYVFARYRLPLVPPLLLFAGHAVARGIDAAATRRLRALVLGAAALLALVALVHLDVRWLGLSFTAEVGHQNLGFVRLREGDAEGAAEEFARAVEINPDLAPSWMQLARLLRDAGRTDAERATLQGFLEHADRRRRDGAMVADPALEAEARVRLAMLHRDTGRAEEALEELRRASALLPDDPAAPVHLGILLRALGRLDEAGAAYREALRRDPGNPLVLINLASLLQEEGDTASAAERLREAAASCGARAPDLCPVAVQRLAALEQEAPSAR